MADQYFTSSWGGIRIWASSVSTDRGRNQVVHDPAQGDEYTVQDRGRRLRSCSVDLLFDEMDGDSMSPRERLEAFLRLIDAGAPAMFTHPVEGSFIAAISDFTYEMTVGSISGRATFLESGAASTVVDAGAGATSPAGENAVASAAAAADAELAAIGYSSAVPASTEAMVRAWGDEPGPRTVLTDLASGARRISDEIEALDLESSIAAWPACQAMFSLMEALRAAADVATATVRRVFRVRVNEPTGLRSLLASIYGADETDDRMVEALAMNDIRNPALIEHGAELVLPAKRTP